jgi:hypothetical protein
MANFDPYENRPVPSSLEAILEELYQGEVGGEAFFCVLLSRFKQPDQQYKLGTLLQLETELKARLRPIAFAHGVDLVERDESRREIGKFAQDALDGETWEEVIASFAELMKAFVARFQALAASLPAKHAELGKVILEHETSIGEFAMLEAAGETSRSIERVAKQIIHPLPPPG